MKEIILRTEKAVRNVLALGLFCFSIVCTAQEAVPATDEAIDQQIEEVTQAAEVKAAVPSEELIAGEMKNLKETTAKSSLAESEVPVLATVSAQKGPVQDPMSRLFLSLAVVIGVALALFLIAKVWSKRKTGLKQHHQIKVLTQYALGPKKSLAIIRVAGESILIGVTDQNISMIKSLSLIDDELPDMAPQHFDGELSRAGNSDEDFSFASVSDRVTRSSNQMRSL